MPEITNADRRLFRIVPHRIASRRRLTRVKLWIAITIWVTVGLYSGLATFFGYKTAQLGDVAVIITIASQFFTMIYAIPEFSAISRRLLGHATIPALIVLCLTAHIISFLGSAFYHYNEASKTKSLGLTANQLNILDDTRNKVYFNTIGHDVFLEGLEGYYEGKAKESENGFGVTGRSGQGARYRLYMNTASEVRSEHALFNTKVNLDEARAIIYDNNDINEFIANLRLLPTAVTHPESDVGTLGESQRLLNNLQNERPNLDFNAGEVVPEPRHGREVISAYIKRYPFVQVSAPVEALMTGGGKIEGLGQILKALSPFDSNNGGYNVTIGLMAGGVLEIAVFIFNIFVNLLYRNLASIKRRTDRSTIINASYSSVLQVIMWYKPASQSIQRIDNPRLVTMLEMVKKFINSGLDRQDAMKCTEFSSKPYHEGEEDDSYLRTIWNRWGAGYESVYYKIKPSWIHHVMEGKISKADNIYHLPDDVDIADIWWDSFQDLLQNIITHLTRTGEVQVYEMNHWIDPMDFNDWVSEMHKTFGSCGTKLPDINTVHSTNSDNDFFNEFCNTVDRAG